MTRRRLPRLFIGGRWRVMIGLGVLTALAVVAAWILPLSGSHHPHRAAPGLHAVSRAWHAPSDGADPKAAGCAGDAETVAVAQIRIAEPVVAAGRLFPRGTVIGTVELRYSPHCRAAWGRVTPSVAFDHPMSGRETVGVARPADGAAEPFRPGRVEEAYSNLLRTGHGCLLAYAVFAAADGHKAAARTSCRKLP
jgi:hypothetical protein